MPKENKENLRDKLDGNELDLSLSNLTTVPVKELAALPRATHLDFSCNQITVLPDAFCTLTHLVKIDLSKNALTQLPANIGSLQRLQYLDLYSNQLTSLPVGICYLKNLKWLDLKDNPLNEHLKSVAGDCLDDVQCKRCAMQVVAFMKQVQSEQERQKQKKLQEERELEAARKADEDREKERKKAEKKAEKERKRKAYEEAKAQRHAEEKPKSQPDHSDEVKTANGVKTVTPKKERTGLSCCGAFMAALLGLVAILIGLYFYCDHNKADAMCQTSREHVLKYYNQARIALESYTAGKQ